MFLTESTFQMASKLRKVAAQKQSKKPRDSDLVTFSDSDDDDFKPLKTKNVSNGSTSSNANVQMKSKKGIMGGKEKTCIKDLQAFHGVSALTSSPSSKNARSADLENEVIVVHETIKKNSCDSNSKASCNSESDGKDAWKNLMQQMQSNQKDIKSTKASKKVKTTFKRGLTQSPAQKKETESLKEVHSPFKKFPRLGTTDQDDSHNSSPTGIDATLDQRQTPVSNSNNEALKIAPIFLPPAERKALQKARATEFSSAKSTDTNHLLNSIVESSLETPEEEAGYDNPDHFDGNVIILNRDKAPVDNAPAGQIKTKQCPFYKKLPGVPFCVDAFNYGIIPGMEVYFLSHFHSDHYIGLSKKFSKTIVCSRPTGNLVRLKLYVEEKCIRKLRLNKPYIVCDSEVTLIDANHCPGSVLFVFRLKTGQCILHTGDFRYSPVMLKNPFVVARRVDWLYLDTTYCSPQYDFPTQSASISTVIMQVKKHLDYRPQTLILCGSYLIGKERVYMTLAEAIGSKVFALRDKQKVIDALENSRFSSLLTREENDAIVHVVPMFSITAKNLQEYLSKRPQYTNIIGIKPSGWQFSSSGNGCSIKTHYGDTVTVLGIPYSEHSSFSELKEFVSSLRPKRVQPTVNVGNAKKRGEMMQHIENWLLT